MLLLTGATGLVGSGLLPHLQASRPSRQVMRLTRPEGDITRRHLGLDLPRVLALQDSVTEIIHCAADTRFGLPLEEARAANTTGTKNVLEFARGCRRLEKFAHMSTVYVAGRTAGRIEEAPLQHQNGFCNTYQQSKYEAEELVLAASRGLPVVIFRPSSIIGDSRTGKVQRFNHVHQLLKILPMNVLPVAPGDPSAPVDLIPSDWATAVLAYLFDNRFVPGRIYQVCAGPERSLTLREMLDWTVELLNRPVLVPELVSLTEYEKFVERSRRNGDKLLNELLRVLGYFLPHLGLFQAFENRKLREGLAGSGIELPNIREYYPKVVRYCSETNWGRYPS